MIQRKSYSPLCQIQTYAFYIFLLRSGPTYREQWYGVLLVFHNFFSLYPPQRSWGGYTGFTLFVRSSVCPFVRSSVRPSVRCRCQDNNWNYFHRISIFFCSCITWVKILYGIEYGRHTSVNMRIMTDHVTEAFLAFLKSIAELEPSNVARRYTLWGQMI